MSLEEPQVETKTRKTSLLQGSHIAQLRLNMDAMISLLYGDTIFRIVASPIPATATLRSFYTMNDGCEHMMCCIVEDPSFPLWHPGEVIPTLGEITVERVINGAFSTSLVNEE